MRQKILTVLVSLTLVCLTIYLGLNSEAIPRKIATFVDFYQHRFFGGKCEALWERINYTDLGYKKSKDFGKYAVPMYEYLNWTSSNIPPSPTNCPACTNLLMKEAVRSTHRVPFNGTWLRYVINATQDLYHFHPHFCSFSEKDLTKSYVQRCLAKKNIRKLVTIGDSNSMRLVKALVNVLSASMDRCKLVAVGATRLADPKYYLKNVSFNNLSDVEFHPHQCSTCISRKYVCSYNTTGKDRERMRENRAVELEQIANLRIIDSSMVIKVKLGKILPTNVSQEFILRDYLSYERYPDIILYQTSFTHEIFYGLTKSPGTTGKLLEPLKKLRKLIAKYVPSTTSVYWIPNHDIYEGDSNSHYRNPLLRESIDVFSEEMESVLGSTSNNIFTFFDLFELSRPLKSWHLARESTHMKPEWYDIIAKYILELHCNS